ncbi:MAG: NUDIX hydrolase [Candidatus Eremiobacteraeota bacterium]|nr:NUDIX hydrolase [Candidatus Eremiobacteraeota bacterium]
MDSPRIHLVTGVVERDGAVLLASSRYRNLAQPLWNLPGGRQRHGELLHDALRREFDEEASLAITIGELRYVAESYDPTDRTHFTNFAFAVESAHEPRLRAGDAHVIELAWVPCAELAQRLSVAVVREPLLANLQDRSRRYFAFTDAGITIEFSDSP